MLEPLTCGYTSQQVGLSLGNYTFVVCDCTAKDLVSWANSCKAILVSYILICWNCDICNNHSQPEYVDIDMFCMPRSFKYVYYYLVQDYQWPVLQLHTEVLFLSQMFSLLVNLQNTN